MLLRILLLVFIVSTGVFADTIIAKGGKSQTGIVTKITDQSISLRVDCETHVVQRASVEEIGISTMPIVHFLDSNDSCTSTSRCADVNSDV